MIISDLQKEVHEIAKATKFWDKERNIGELIALAHSELSEALEEDRKGYHPQTIYYEGDGSMKPHGFPIELADTIIRILDMAEGLGINIEEAIKLKVAYNKTRPPKHGKKY